MGSKIGIATLLAKNQKVMNVTLEKSFVKPMKELAEKLKYTLRRLVKGLGDFTAIP